MRKALFFLMFLLLIFPLVRGQVGQTGEMRGVVVDNQNEPVPGAKVSVSSPALMGVQSVVTSENGSFRFPPILPPGAYTVTVELEGFNTIVRKNVIIRAGMVVELKFEMTPAEIREEITVTAASPTVDVVQSKVSHTVTTEVIRTLPFPNRNVWTFVSVTAPGVRGSRGYIHAEGANAYSFTIDGIQANAPDQNWPEARIDMETVEEVTLVTGGVAAEVYGARSGYMNVITKSGGNTFHGAVQAYYTGENLQQVLTTDEQLEALGLSKPTFDIYNWETSSTLGGPILKDKIWFFGSYKYLTIKTHVPFIPVTIDGMYHGPYERIQKSPYYMGKLTYQINRNLKFFATLNYSPEKIPHYYTAWNRTASASANNYPKTMNSSSDLTWMINANTIADLRIGFYRFNWEGRYTKEADPTGPAYNDAYTGYVWGHRGLEEYTYKWIWNFRLDFIRYQNNFLGADHEFRGGIEYARTRGDWGYWRQNPMNWTYYNWNPYYYRGLYGLTGPHPLYGDGLLSFAIVGTKRGESQRVGTGDRYAFYIQDRLTIKNRLTIYLGLRYDYIYTSIKEETKKAAGGNLAAAIGEYYIVPGFGFNPYLEVIYEGWNGCYPYRAPAPSFGLTYDLFGNGKTAFKLSYGHYYTAAATGTWSSLQPAGPNAFSFYWWDLNQNGQPDLPTLDKYQLIPGQNPAMMLSTEFKQRIDPNLKNEYTRELIARIEHELFPHFKVGVAYIYRNRRNFSAYLRYDRETGKYWNTLEAAPEWWAPFTTTVPAYGSFPARTVTVYYMSKQAPPVFTVLTNVPQQKYRYNGFELSFEKRMYNGWYLGGSFNYHYVWSNGGFGTPNARVNAEGRRDIPWWLKLYGVFELPYGFRLSFIYNYSAGGYWGRSVTVYAPTSWINKNNVQGGGVGVTIEPPDLRKGQHSNSMDFRIEKEFSIWALGKLGVFVDIFNLFGQIYPSIPQNPGGTWRPVAENSDQGTYTPGQMKVTGIGGVRSFKLSFRFTF